MVLTRAGLFVVRYFRFFVVVVVVVVVFFFLLNF